jgi:hypothetical protein
MRFVRMQNFLPAALLVGAAFAAASPAAAQHPYDGLWNVTIFTQSGSCDRTASYPLTVTDGHVSAPGADVSGKIAATGVVRVAIGPAFANGQLNGNAGAGKWNGASNGVPCSGRWEASRQ